MTQEQVNASTKSKVDKIEALMKELQITVTPEEVVTQSGIIKRVVYYMDNEKYELETPTVQ
jgi:hypothetical protein